MKGKSITTIVLALFIGHASAQTDKAEADQIIYEMLTSKNQTENWHPGLVIQESQLKETNEKGIFVVLGDSFQIKSLRSDFYVSKKKGRWEPINDARYPLETMVNLLLNHINDNRHMLEIRHHQYGGKKPTITLPMQDIFDLLARNMDLYCSVTYINEHEIRAILVFHQRSLNFIHMLELKVGTKKLFDAVVIPSIKKHDSFLVDYKSKLQELVQTTKKSLEYKVINESGPAHDKVFEVEVVIDGITYGKGIGKSKKEAEQKAAYDAYRKQAK